MCAAGMDTGMQRCELMHLTFTSGDLACFKLGVHIARETGLSLIT